MTNELAHEHWLFRFRWFMPLTLLPLALLAALEADPTGMHLGRSLKDWWEGLCLLIALSGLVVRALAVGFPEAAAGGRPGERELPTTGMHSIVRYPLFLGTYISLLGLSLLPGAIWFVLATNVVFFLWYGRLVQQTEADLERRFGERHRRWADRTPLFLPSLSLWKQPNGRFSLRTVLRRERHDLYFVIACFVGLEFACDLLGEHLPATQWVREDSHWALLLLIGTLLYLALRLMTPIGATASGGDGATVSAFARGERLGGHAGGPTTRGLRVDGRVRLVDTLENLISGGNLDRILLATLAAAELRAGDRLVDVGCGSGALATLASMPPPDGRPPAGEVVGIDATPGMIELARARARNLGSRARFEIGTAEALPFPDASVDALTNSYLFHHLPSDLKREALREMWRVLKPGGRLVMADYSKPSSPLGYLASIPMRFDFHEYVRGQLSGELERLLKSEELGKVEVMAVFLGYITVYRIVKAAGRVAAPGDRRA